MVDKVTINNIKRHVISVLLSRGMSPAYKSFFSIDKLDKLLNMFERNNGSDFRDSNQYICKVDGRNSKAIKHIAKISNNEFIEYDDNSEVATYKAGLYNLFSEKQQQLDEAATKSTLFYDKHGSPKLSESLTYTDFLEEFSANFESIELDDFAEINSLDHKDIQQVENLDMEKLNVSQITCFKSILIKSKVTSTNLSEIWNYQVKSKLSGEIIEIGKYDIDTSPDTITIDQKVEVDEHTGNNKVFKDNRPKKTIIKFPHQTQNYYVYDAVITQKDANGNNENVTIQVQSYTPLKQSMYDLYGFIRPGESSLANYIHCIGATEVNKKPLSFKDIIKNPNKHNFFQLYEFLIKHIRDSGFQLDKGKSDVLLFMETLKILIRLVERDYVGHIKAVTHSLYLGLANLGKSYISELYFSIIYPNVTKAPLAGTSKPGLTGGANQQIIVPNATIKTGQAVGALGRDGLILEEITENLNKRNDDAEDKLSVIKDALFSNMTDNAKVGGDKVPRTARVTMLGNHSKVRNEKIRQEILSDIRAKTLRELSKLHNSGKMSGESHNILEGSDVVNIQPNDNNTNDERLNKIEVALETIDVFNVPTEHELMEYDLDNVCRLSIITAIKKIHDRYRTNYEVDIASGLPSPVMRRFCFSVIGTAQETDATTKLTVKDDPETKIEEYLPLYLPQLKEAISAIVDKSISLNTNSERLNRFVEHCNSKYEHVFKTLGDNSFPEFFDMVLKSLCMFNNEVEPSYDTLKIIERWIWLQGNKVTASDAKSFKLLDKKINYWVDKVEIKERFFKDD